MPSISFTQLHNLECQEEGCNEKDNLVRCHLVNYRSDLYGISPVHVMMQYGLRAMWDYLKLGWYETFDYYCPEHCQKNGYCYGCGEFWSGSESFDFGNGLCSNCKGDLGEDDYEEDYYYEDDDFNYYHAEEYEPDEPYPDEED